MTKRRCSTNQIGNPAGYGEAYFGMAPSAPATIGVIIALELVGSAAGIGGVGCQNDVITRLTSVDCSRSV